MHRDSEFCTKTKTNKQTKAFMSNERVVLKKKKCNNRTLHVIDSPGRPSFEIRSGCSGTWPYNTSFFIRISGRMLKHWNRLPRAAVSSPSLQIFQTWLDTAACSSWPCCEQGSKLQRSLSTLAFLWFHPAFYSWTACIRHKYHFVFNVCFTDYANLYLPLIGAS